MKWIFGNPTPPYQDPVDKEFFSLDQIQDDAMVREAGQNSRDALLESETLVRLRFTIIEESKNSMEQSKFFADLYEHINADESGITTPPPNDEKYRFLVIEDFFTHGLLGDINYVSTREPQKINHYYYLLRWLGRTGFDLQQEEQEGKIILGGCCVTDDDPDWHCKECKHEWSDSFSKKERLR